MVRSKLLSSLKYLDKARIKGHHDARDSCATEIEESQSQIVEAFRYRALHMQLSVDKMIFTTARVGYAQITSFQQKTQSRLTWAVVITVVPL